MRAREKLWPKVARWLPVVFLAVSLPPALADDGRIGPHGGLVALIDGEDEQVVMRSGRVSVEMTPERATVDCRFVFGNTGPATTVLMGFPEEAYTERGAKKGGGLRAFRAWVDGVRVRTTWRLDRGGMDYLGWHTKRVCFGRGQTRVVRDTFEPSYGGVVGGLKYFTYPMCTGASWKGPIGLMEVSLRLRRFGGKTIEQLDPEPTWRRGGLMRWRWENIEPGNRAPGSVKVFFYPWYADVFVNGQRRKGDVVDHAVLRGRRVFVPLKGASWDLANWVSYDSRTQTAYITRGRRSLEVTAGSREALADGEPWRLCAAPYISFTYDTGYQLMVPLRSFVEQLGGTVHFDSRMDRTYVWYPQERS